MTFCYLASFDVADRREDFGAVSFSRSGSTTITINLYDFATDDAPALTVDGSREATVFNHYSDSPYEDLIALDAEESTGIAASLAALSFPDQMTAWLRLRANALGWPSPNSLTCSFSTSTLRYTFSYGGGTFSNITFSTTAGGHLFGFLTDPSGFPSASVSGTHVPLFAIAPELPAVTTPSVDDGYDYEPGGISACTVAAMGSKFGLTRSAVPQYRDWVQQSEPRNKALRFDARNEIPESSPGSHQDLFEACRCVLPFVVVDGFGDGFDYLFRLRADSCLWSTDTCRRAGNDMDHSHFDIIYRTQALGVFT